MLTFQILSPLSCKHQPVVIAFFFFISVLSALEWFKCVLLCHQNYLEIRSLAKASSTVMPTNPYSIW